MGEGKISVNEGKIPSSSWNQLLPPQGARDELSWAEKNLHRCQHLQPQALPRLRSPKGQSEEHKV